MGAITNRNDSYEIAKEAHKEYRAAYLRQNGMPETSYGFGSLLTMSLSQQLPNLIAGGVNIACNKAERNSEDLYPEEIQEEINEILKKYDSADISTVELKQGEYNNLISRAEQDETKADNTIKQCEAQIGKLKTDLEALESLPADHPDRAQIADIQNKIKEIEHQKEDAEIQAEEAKNIKTGLQTNLQTLEKDLKDLHYLEKQLKKADGREAMEKYTNDDTENITGILTKLNKAKDNPEKEAKLKDDLKKSLEEYYGKGCSKHKVGDNKTIDNLARLYNIKAGA